MKLQYQALRCDGCGWGTPGFPSVSRAKDWARQEGWFTGRRKHYCRWCRDQGSRREREAA